MDHMDKIYPVITEAYKILRRKHTNIKITKESKKDTSCAIEIRNSYEVFKRYHTSSIENREWFSKTEWTLKMLNKGSPRKLK